MQIQFGGHRQRVSLATNNREEASRKAARLYQSIRDKGWAVAMAEFNPAPEMQTPKGTVGEFIETVTPLLNVRARTVEVYSYALRKIAAGVSGHRDGTKARFNPKNLAWREAANAVPLSRVTPEAVEKWKARFIADAGKSPIEITRAKRSVNSFVRNARALFGRRVLRRLREMAVALPDPLPFQGVELERAGSTRYVSTIDATRLLRDGRADLAKQDPEAWKVILLALGAGLRRSEIDGLCWTQIDFGRGVVRVVSHEHFEAKTEDSEGEVFVAAGLLAELRPLLKADSLFVVEPDTPPPTTRAAQCYRCKATFERATAWLRANGVMTGKPLHTLRKEFGSIIAAQADIHTASRQLRHADIQTTAAYYTDHRRRATVDVGDMLKESKG